MEFTYFKKTGQRTVNHGFGDFSIVDEGYEFEYEVDFPEIEEAIACLLTDDLMTALEEDGKYADKEKAAEAKAFRVEVQRLIYQRIIDTEATEYLAERYYDRLHAFFQREALETQE